MASSRAIAATCEAVVRLLRSHYEQDEFGGVLDFQVYVAEEFTRPMAQGVSLMLYRIYQNGTQRMAAGRLLPSGERLRAPLPLDLHFMLTAWARHASLQHEIAGWMMRVLEDNPVLPANVLNAYQPNVFHRSEAVEVALTQLTVEETFRIWEVVVGHGYQLSVPYVARPIRIDAPELRRVAIPVQERVIDFHEPEPSAT